MEQENHGFIHILVLETAPNVPTEPYESWICIGMVGRNFKELLQ